MKVREAKFEDYEPIAALAQRNHLPLKPFDGWMRLWKENPLAQPLPIGWVLEADRQNIVGYLGNVPLQCSFQGRTLVAAATHAWVVDPEARGQSILLINKFLHQKPVDLLLNTTANLEAQKVFEAFHIPRVPARDYDVALYWITEPIGFAAAALRKKNIPLAAALSLPLGVAMSFKCPKPQVDPKFSERTSFGAEFDAFWAALAAESKTVLGCRNREWLRWHFADDLAEKRISIVVEQQEGRLESYAIFVRHHAEEIGLTRLRLVDYQSLDPHSGSLGPMIDFAIDKCRREKIHLLESIGFGESKRRVLESKKPLRRQLPAWMYFFKCKDAALANQLALPESWDPNMFDGDGSL